MDLQQRLFDLRRQAGLSQEEIRLLHDSGAVQ